MSLYFLAPCHVVLERWSIREREDSRASDQDMMAEIRRSPEAFALERIAGAAREVQAASAALEKHFDSNGAAQPSTLELARFAAAMQELRDAREEFDRLLSQKRQQ